MTAEVTLDELERDGVVVHLDDERAAALSATGLVEVRPQGHGRWALVPRGFVGAVRTGDLQVQVNPKERVGLSRLLFMLGYARDPGFRPQDVEAVERADLWAALAESLVRVVERALAGGVLQGYRTVDDALRTVRGRIRIGDQLRVRPGHMLPLEVSYDEFTVDTPENSILRSALRRMSAVPRVPRALAARLRHLDARLEGVRVLPRGGQLPRWTPTRLNRHYQPALRLAELVLRNASTEPGAGGMVVASFVVPMWKVFEDFVTTALQEALLAHPGRTVAQYPDWLDEPAPGHWRGAVRMDVDIVHLDATGTPRIVFDAKYKAAGGSGQYPNADHYQMLAYCTALRVPVAWLVYAQGSTEPAVRRIRNTDVSVVEYALDLSVPPRALLEQVHRLADAAVRTSVREPLAL
ncbi:restriction endonuclease [Georgenia phoenicis]|uniref:McrC family protein n=1 Tax=unclassified Georgenia TaxID=2626815 RepID=UPI0039AF8849